MKFRPLLLLPGLCAALSSCSLVRRAEPVKPVHAPMPPPPQQQQQFQPRPDAAQFIPRQLGPGLRTTYTQCKVPGPYIAMTFDDGPHPQNTPRLLDMLRERNIKATFFVIGTSAQAYPSIIRRTLAEGHEIASHTRTHAKLSGLSDASVHREITGGNEAIFNASGGYRPQVFRPPYGAITARQKDFIMHEFGLPSVLWSVDPLDWKRPGVSVVAQRLISGARPGGILLAHDLHAPTIQAVPEVLDTLRGRGFQFVTVSQLINLERGAAAPPPPGYASNFGAGSL